MDVPSHLAAEEREQETEGRMADPQIQAWALEGGITQVPDLALGKVRQIPDLPGRRCLGGTRRVEPGHVAAEQVLPLDDVRRRDVQQGRRHELEAGFPVNPGPQ